MSSVRTSAAARDAARVMVVVVFPTPPFWFAIAMMRAIGFVPRGTFTNFVPRGTFFRADGSGLVQLENPGSSSVIFFFYPGGARDRWAINACDPNYACRFVSKSSKGRKQLRRRLHLSLIHISEPTRLLS